LSLGVTSADGTSTALPFDASINARAATTTGNNSQDKADTADYNKLVASDASLTTSFVYPNGTTAKASIQAGLAASKSSAAGAAAAIVKFSKTTVKRLRDARSIAVQRCSGNNSSVTTVVVDFSGNPAKRRLTYTCATRVGVVTRL